FKWRATYGARRVSDVDGQFKYIVLPAMGFFAGFFVKWFLQERKSRDEPVEALASPRADALRELWAITTLRPEIALLKEDEPVPFDVLCFDFLIHGAVAFCVGIRCDAISGISRVPGQSVD